MSLLGIDLGTSSVKAVLADPDGTVLARAGAAYPVSRPHPGWAETDPQDWWAAVVTAVRSVLGSSPVAAVQAVGLSGQMHGLVLCAADGTPVRPAMLWADSRATAELAAYRALAPNLATRLANPLVPGMAGPMLLWLQAHEPAVVDRAAFALQPKDWLRARLTGRVAGEPSDASATLLFDVANPGWDDDVVAALGLPRRLLPELLSFAGAVAGELLPSPAAELGLPSGIPVAAGAADTAAAALGSGLFEPGTAQLTIGTGVQLVTPITAPGDGTIEPDPVTHRYRSATRGGWYAMGASITGGQTLGWVRGLLGVEWDELYAVAGRGPVEGDPIFLPYLIGERTPHLDTSIRGAWVGLGAGHDRSALLYSALEGVAFATADVLDALRAVHPIDVGTGASLRLAGGGTASPAWRQLLADALGVVLRPVDAAEASGRGAALLAAQVAGLIADPAPDRAFGSADPWTGAVVVPDRRSEQLTQRRAAHRAVLAGLYPMTGRSADARGTA